MPTVMVYSKQSQILQCTYPSVLEILSSVVYFIVDNLLVVGILLLSCDKLVEVLGLASAVVVGCATAVVTVIIVVSGVGCDFLVVVLLMVV